MNDSQVHLFGSSLEMLLRTDREARQGKHTDERALSRASLATELKNTRIIKEMPSHGAVDSPRCSY